MLLAFRSFVDECVFFLLLIHNPQVPSGESSFPIFIIIIIFINSESAHAQALASYIVTEFWAGQQGGGPRLLLPLISSQTYEISHFHVQNISKTSTSLLLLSDQVFFILHCGITSGKNLVPDLGIAAIYEQVCSQISERAGQFGP